MLFKITIALIAVSVVPISAVLDSFNASIPESISDNDNSEILSRRKRFLIFPDGSSFQFVFCTQNHGYIQIGDIIWFAETAAMAWELPDDPSLFSMLKSELRDPAAARRQDGPNKHIYYLDEVGKVIAKVPYKRKKTMNPVFAKRSTRNDDEKVTSKKDLVKKMHELQKARSYLHNFDEASANFHRMGRHGFYKKLATFFEAVGMRGHHCVLRMLCEVGKANNEQGTFMQELVRATFTLPKGASHYAEEGVEYDKAHNAEGDCAVLYPECEDLDGQ